MPWRQQLGREGLVTLASPRDRLDPSRQTKPGDEPGIVTRCGEAGRYGRQRLVGCRPLLPAAEGQAAQARRQAPQHRRIRFAAGPHRQCRRHGSRVIPVDRLGHRRRDRPTDAGVRVIEHFAQPRELSRVLHPPKRPYSHCADRGILAPEVRTHAIQPVPATRILLGHDLGVCGEVFR